MFIFALYVLLFFVAWDCRMLKRHDTPLFFKTFQVQTFVWSFCLFFMATLIVFTELWQEALSFFILFFVFPLYFSKRREFLKIITAEDRFWVGSHGLRVIMYWFFGILCFSTLTHGYLLWSGAELGELEDMVLSAAFSSLLLMGLIVQSASCFQKKNIWIALGFSAQKISFFRKIIVPCVLGIFMAYFSATVISERGIQPDTPLSQALEADRSSWSIPLFVFLAIVVAPLVEEITFRGFFYNVLKKVKGQRWAFYVIALTFGGLHMAQYWGDWAAILVIMIMGFWLTLIRVWSGTTAASVAMHYFYNIGVIVITTILEISKGTLGG